MSPSRSGSLSQVEWGGAFSASAQTPAASGVVIRERVELRPSVVGPPLAVRTDGTTGGCGSPVAEAVFVGLNAGTYGAPLDGTLDVTSECASESVSLVRGFRLVSSDDWTFDYVPRGEILRVPLGPTDTLPTATATVAGETTEMSNSMHFGCWRGYVPCDSSPPDFVEASVGIRVGVDGWAVSRTHAWPDTVDCGTTTPLPITLVKPDGSEGYVGPASVQDFQMPGGASDARGALSYNGTTGGRFSVPYADTRAAAVSYVAPGCATMRAPADATIWVTGFPYGGLLDDAIHVRPPPPARFFVPTTPDTLAAGSAGWVSAVAVAVGGAEAYLAPLMPVTLVVSDRTLGILDFPGGAAGPSLTLPYNRSYGWYSSGARSGMYFQAAETPPRCTATATVTATAADGLTGFGRFTILGTSTAGPDTLIVTASPETIAPGDSAVVMVSARSVDGCDVSASIPDSMRMAVASFGGGTLVYAGVRSPIILDVPLGDLRSGAVRFIADSEACDPTDMLVRVEGAGLIGQTIVSVTGPAPPPQREAAGISGARIERRPNFASGFEARSCQSRHGPTESKEDIVGWFQSTCPALAGLSSDSLNSAVEKLYERNLVLHLGNMYPNGLGWGSLRRLYGGTPSYPLSENAGVDGFGMWLPDLHMGFPDWSYTTVRDYVTVLFESKLSSRALNSTRDLVQATRHVDFLASEYQRRVADFPDHLHSFPPVLILTSQNTDPTETCGPDRWNLAASYCPNSYGTATRHDQLVTHAANNGVLVVHAKVARVPFTNYRNVVVRMMNEVPLLDDANPILGWLLREGTTIRMDDYGTTYETWLPLSFDCDAVTDTPRDRVPQ